MKGGKGGKKIVFNPIEAHFGARKGMRPGKGRGIRKDLMTGKKGRGRGTLEVRVCRPETNEEEGKEIVPPTSGEKKKKRGQTVPDP